MAAKKERKKQENGETVDSICIDIKSLKIQGSRNIAISAVKALCIQSHLSEAKNIEQFYGELVEAADRLASTRPTEPMLRNSIRYLLAKVEAGMAKRGAEVEGLKKLVEAQHSSYLKNMQKSVDIIAEIGSREIPENATVFVHCHSSTVTSILKRASDAGKLGRVICTETRPKFQGRITAKELSEYGIDTTLIVDSAASVFLPQCQLVLVGADAISSAGDLVNKIGTRGIAQLAYYENVPLYSAAELYKFEPVTMWGKGIDIEERECDEVAQKLEFPRLKIRNPAFDVTPARYIKAYITEQGIVAPSGLVSLAAKEFNIGKKM